MIWKLLADAVLAFHAAWVLAIVLGPLWCWKRPGWRWVHLAMMAVVILFGAVLGDCPLTDLENQLGMRANSSFTYPGGFLAHYVLEGIVYWDLPQWVLTAACAIWLAGWGAGYAFLWRRERKED
jgi:hypothetical protein